jgi:hypothetical protein
VQIDQARIAIHERTWLDNLDLALHVARAHAKGLAIAALVGIGPAALLNYALVVRLHGDGFPEAVRPGSYVLMAFLILLEAPLATAPLTLFLGHSLFVEHPRAKLVARELWESLPQLFLLQGITRFLLFLAVVTAIVPYVMWPYLNEVILLERNPLSSRRGQISTLKRNSILHRGNGGEFLLRAIVAALLAPLLTVALWAALRFGWQTMLGVELSWRGQIIAFQFVAWLVTIYFTVARFLTYLDQRIRYEGWEVELCLRAEREILLRRLA